MTQIVRWIAQTFATLKGPSAPDLPPQKNGNIGDARRINEIINPPIERFLFSRGYRDSMVGNGWCVNSADRLQYGVVVTLVQLPTKEDIIELAKMAQPFPLMFEITPELREICSDLIEAAIALGQIDLKVEVIKANLP